MADRDMKKCSTLLIIMKIQIITMMRYQRTPVNMAIIKKRKQQMLMRMWRNWNTYALLVGN